MSNRRGQPIWVGPPDGRWHSGIWGLGAPRWCLPPGFNHRWEHCAQRHHRTLDLRSPVRIASTHGFLQGTLDQAFRFAQRRLL